MAEHGGKLQYAVQCTPESSFYTSRIHHSVICLQKYFNRKLSIESSWLSPLCVLGPSVT